MQLSYKLGVIEVLAVAVHEHLSGLLVQSALRERNNQQAFYHLENVIDRPVLRVPVLL